MKKTYIYNGKEIVASSKKEAIHQIVSGTKVTSRFYKEDIDKLNKCLDLLEKQSVICGTHFYFELDEEKEVVNVYLDSSKNNIYLTVNVGSDSTSAAMYDIWKKIYHKF